MTNQPVVHLQDVAKTYRTLLGKPKKEAVRGVSFTIYEGEIFGLLGPNGAGKTTIIRLLCGLLTPSRGQITIRGVNPIAYRKEYRQQLGTLLEGNRGLYWRLSAMENLQYFGTLRGETDGTRLRSRSEELLTFFGLYDVRNEPVSDFSRGMQQKVALALAMINEPDLLLLDEPTLGLDAKTAAEIQQLIRQLAREHQTSILLTSHNMHMVENVSDRVAILHHGELIAKDDTRRLTSLWETNWYEFVVEGELAPPVVDEITRLGTVIESDFQEATDQTRTVLEFSDTRVFYQVLDVLRTADYATVRAGRVELDLETVFLRLTETPPADTPAPDTRQAAVSTMSAGS